MSTIVRVLFETGFPSAGPLADVRVHEELQDILAAGAVPQRVSDLQTLPPLDIAYKQAQTLGYHVDSTPVKYDARRSEAEKNAFDAATGLVMRRLSPNVLYTAFRFVCREPLAATPTVRVFDQLWLCSDEPHADRVRQLALQLDPLKLDDPDERKRDLGFSLMSYEMFHASIWWMRVDALRVIQDFLDLAGVPVINLRPLSYPGDTIKDYKCDFCRGPMVRTPSGYGIIERADRFVHEECFEAAVNQGFFDQN